MPPRRRTQTLIGAQATNAISRFSSDVAGFVRTRYSNKNGMKNLASDVSKLMSVINTEDKHIDYLLGPLNNFSTFSQCVFAGAPAQGITVNSRIGDSILVNKIDLEITFSYSGSAATATIGSQSFRWWLIRYKKTPPSGGSIAFNPSEFLIPDINGNYSPMSLMNTDTNENFQVMTCGDLTVDLPTLATNQLTYSKVTTLRHNCHFHQEFNGPAASNICDGAVFFLSVALNPNNTGGSSLLTLASRIYFVDN